MKPTLLESLEIVLSLAADNALDPDDLGGDDDLLPEALRQQEAIAIVQKLAIDTEDEENAAVEMADKIKRRQGYYCTPPLKD